MLTNKNCSFQNSCAIETGLYDFHKMTVSVLKCYFGKAKPKVIFYRNYKNFSNERFKSLITNKNRNFPAGNYMFKVNNRNTRTRCEICYWCRSGVFIVNCEHISPLVLVFLLLTLSRLNAGWVTRS